MAAHPAQRETARQPPMSPSRHDSDARRHCPLRTLTPSSGGCAGKSPLRVLLKHPLSRNSSDRLANGKCSYGRGVSPPAFGHPLGAGARVTSSEVHPAGEVEQSLPCGAATVERDTESGRRVVASTPSLPRCSPPPYLHILSIWSTWPGDGSRCSGSMRHEPPPEHLGKPTRFRGNRLHMRKMLT